MIIVRRATPPHGLSRRGCTHRRWRPGQTFIPGKAHTLRASALEATAAQSFQAPFIKGTYIKDQLSIQAYP